MGDRSARRWPGILLAAYWLALATVTHWPKMPGFDVPGKDKTLHVVAYGILAGLLLNVPARGRGWSRAGIIAATAIITAIYGGLDEWTQPWSGRSCELGDWIADMAGVMLACGGYLGVAMWRGPGARVTAGLRAED